MSTKAKAGANGKACGEAVRLLAAGYWPVVLRPPGSKIPGRDEPAQGKEPMDKAWGEKRLTLDELHRRYKSRPGAGVGICLGPQRAPNGGWLIDMEGDGPRADTSRETLLGGEKLATKGWSSTRGGHELVTADADRLAPLIRRLDRYLVADASGVKAVLKNLPGLPDLELRIGGFKDDGKTVKQVQSACPPTIGTDGRPREWNGVEHIAELPGAAYAYLERVATEMERPPAPGPTAPPHAATKPSATNGRPGAEARAIAYLAKCDPAISGRKGHNKTFGVACRVGPGFDLPPEIAFRLMRDYYNPRCEPPWSEKELQYKIDDAYKNAKKPRGWLLTQDRPDYHRGNGARLDGTRQHDGTARDGRPTIEWTADEHQAVDEVLKILPKNPDLYRRGNLLVSVGVESEDEIRLAPSSVMRHVAGIPKILVLSPALVGYHLSRLATFFRWKKDSNGEDIPQQIPPPARLVATIHAFGIYPGVRHLLGVAECPYPRSDGSIASKAGYDPETGTLVIPFVGYQPPDPGPDKKAACEAVKRLLDLVKDFPFAADADRVVWLAGLLTAIARPAIAGPVPGVAINSNIAGTGKGLLVDEIAIIATGRRCPTTNYPEDKEEAGKVKVAIALAAPPIVLFDNLAEGSSYGNSSLDSAITALSINDRILGESRNTGDLILRTTWFLTGNNISPGKDAYRRWLPCNLASSLERPEERDDIVQKDLRAHTLAHRAELVRDALTIFRAHARAGYPAASKAPLGSFEEWDRLVRGAVYYASGFDPCKTRRDAADEAPERKQKLALLEGWRTLPEGGDGGNGHTTQQAVTLLEKAVEEKALGLYEGIHATLVSMTRDGKLPTPRALGYIIRAMAGANIGGFKFEKAPGEKNHTTLWRVVKVAPSCPYSQKTAGPDGRSGDAGDGRPQRGRAPGARDNVKTSESKSPRAPIGGSGSPASPDLPSGPDSDVVTRLVPDAMVSEPGEDARENGRKPDRSDSRTHRRRVRI